MALLSFPTSPTNGQLYPTTPLPGQNQYEWEAATQTWRLLGAATTVTSGCYGDGSNVPAFCVDAQGRITSVVNVPITSGGTVTSVDASGGTTGLTFSGGPITSSGVLTLGGVLGVANGGTGVSTGVVTSVIAGTAINVSAATGAVTIDNTGVTSNVAGTGISVSAGTGSVTIGNTGVLSFDGGTTGLTPAAAATGAVSLGGVLNIANGGTGGTTVATAQANLLPTQAGNSGKVLSTDGAGVISWIPVGGSGTVTSVDVSGGTTGLTFTGGPVTASGTITAGGILAVANGGTGTSTGAVTSVTGTAPISVATGTSTPVVSVSNATTGATGVVQVGTNIDVTAGTISVADASTTTKGVVQLNDTVSNTSTTLALTANQGKVLQNQIDALVISNNLTLAGTLNAATGLLDTVTPEGTLAGFTVGAVLPNASVTVDEYFVIVTTGAASYTPPGGVAGATTAGDWYLASTTAWTRLALGFTGVTTVTGTLPIVSSGGTNPDVSVNAATTSAKGVVQVGTNIDVTAGTISVKDASATDKGVIEIATLAEAATGTDATRALTPETGVPKDASGMTGAAILPSGTTGQQPGTLVAGMTRYNTTTGDLEFYTGSAWNGATAKVAGTASTYDEGASVLPSGTTAQRPATPLAGMTRVSTATHTPETYANGSWQTVQSTSSGQFAGFRNIIINGWVNTPYEINQRVVSYGAAAVGGYFADRWKKTAGGMTQIIEAGSFVPSSTYTLSGVGITTTQLVSPAAGDWTLPDISSAASYVQLEYGYAATSFELRSFSVEMNMCQRYYFKTYPTSVAPGTASNYQGARFGQSVSPGSAVMAGWVPVPMRVAPAITIYSVITGAAGNAYIEQASVDRAFTVPDVGNSGFGGIQKVAPFDLAPAQVQISSLHFTAEAEL